MKLRKKKQYKIDPISKEKGLDKYYFKLFTDYYERGKIKRWNNNDLGFSENFMKNNIDTDNRNLANIFYERTSFADNKVYLRLKWGFTS